MRIVRSSLCLLVASTLLTAICFAEAPDRIGTIDSSRMVLSRGQALRYDLLKYDQGRVEASFQLSRVMLLTVPTLSQQRALERLLAEQQDPKSPNFHKWLTPEQYADRFGLSHNDIKKASAWLKSQGLSVVSVARARNWIAFSGTAAQIESALQTQIHRYDVKGEMHFANATPPSIPAALSGIATGFRGLDDFRPKPRARKALPVARHPRPAYSDTNTGLTDFLAPNDIATIYDLTPLYNAATPVDGTGEKLVVVGQTTVYLADLVNFRSGFNLPALYSGCTATSGILTSCTVDSSANFQYVIVNGSATTTPSLNDLSEADLDLEWSAATARGAQIIFDVDLVNGVFNAYYDAIDKIRGQVISMSYGICEFDDAGFIIDPTTTPPSNGSDEIELMLANSEGITFVNSSGDSGAAECDPPPPGLPPDTNDIAAYGLAVSYPASSPEVTGVGGTAVEYPTGFSSTYWGTDNGTNDGGTAISRPPETAWNDDVELGLWIPSQCTSSTPEALCWQESYAIVQSGGGASNCATPNSAETTCVSGFPKPSWQTVTLPTAPGTGVARYTPDVSLLGSPNFPGYIYCTPVEELSTVSPYNHESTSSCGAGGTAGITAAVNGVLNTAQTAYVVQPSLVGGTSASAPVFAGIVTMLNQLLNGANSPGLGNINQKLYTLASTPANGAFHPVTTGTNVVYCAGSTPTNMPSAYQCPGASGTTGSFGFNASNADATTGYNLVTGLGSVDANNLFTAWQGTTTPATVTLSAGAASLQVTPGQTGTATIDITRTGSVPAVSFTCSETTALSSSGSVCTVTPATPTTASSVSLSITTIAPTAKLRRHLESGRGIFYAALLPGLLGVVFTAGSRKRAARGIRFMTLILMLGISTLWLGACGSSNSGGGGSTGGTPAGSYVVTINATTGGANPVTGTTTVTLVVQ